MTPLPKEQAETAKNGRPYFADKTMIEPVYFHAADPETGNLCAIDKVECAEDLARLKEECPKNEIRQESLGDGYDSEMVKKWHFDGNKFINVYDEEKKKSLKIKAVHKITTEINLWFEDHEEKKIMNEALIALSNGEKPSDEFYEFTSLRESFLNQVKLKRNEIKTATNDQLKNIAKNGIVN